MADMFADALMRALKIFMVSVFLFGLCLVVMGVIEVIVLARKTARMKKRERGGQR